MLGEFEVVGIVILGATGYTGHAVPSRYRKLILYLVPTSSTSVNISSDIVDPRSGLVP